MWKNGDIQSKYPKRKARRSFRYRWSFTVILGLGYLSIGIVITLFLLVGFNSGWSFSGDSAGGIGLLYAATIFIPHLILFLFTLVAVTIYSIILWSELHPLTKALVVFYYLVSALILWSNFSANGGYAVRYYARRIFAPDYYAPAPPPEKLTGDPNLYRLLHNYDLEAAAFYTSAEPERNDHYLALRFWRTCMERYYKKSSDDGYRSLRRAFDLSDRIFRGHVRNLRDAIREERPSPLSWTDWERLDTILEQLTEGKDDDHPHPCTESLDTEAIRHLVYRGAANIVDASERWSFLTRRSSRDLLLLDANRTLVADSERGIELWRRTDKGWRYARTLAEGEGAVRLLRRETILFAVLRTLGRGWHLVRFEFNPKTESLREISRLRYDLLGQMTDWDADGNGTLLFLANGYTGVVVIDYRDPSHPKRTKAYQPRRNDRINDLWWAPVRQRLYVATRYGMVTCRKNDEKLQCDAPIPPSNLLALVPLDGHRFLFLKRGTDFNHLIPLLFEQKGSKEMRFPLLPADNPPLPTRGIDYLNSSHPHNALFDGTRLLLPNLHWLTILDENLSLIGCLDTGQIYRFLPLDDRQILTAQGSDGIRMWDLSSATPKQCR